MDLDAYLRRIGVNAPVRADLASLRRLHRAHAMTVPFENLDIHLGAKTTRAPKRAFDKIVARRRGGWCFEMNGLFASALAEIGFSVRRLAGGVMREALGDDALGNHLMLLVDLDDETWLADVGFGDGLVEPVPLRAGPFRNEIMQCELIDLGGGWWRYRNDPRGAAPSYDFHVDLRDEELLEAHCQWLQVHPESPFVMNVVAQRWRDGAHMCLRGRVLQRLTADEKHQETVATAEDYVRILLEEFGLDIPNAVSFWPEICARHEEVFAQTVN